MTQKDTLVETASGPARKNASRKPEGNADDQELGRPLLFSYSCQNGFQQIEKHTRPDVKALLSRQQRPTLKELKAIPFFRTNNFGTYMRLMTPKDQHIEAERYLYLGGATSTPKTKNGVWRGSIRETLNAYPLATTTKRSRAFITKSWSTRMLNERASS